MNNLMTKLYIGTVTKIEAAKADARAKRNENLMNDERGVAGIVAAVLLVLIVVLLVAVFYDKLATWFNGMMDKIFGSENQVDKGKLNQ